jgi:hypothetical protein
VSTAGTPLPGAARSVADRKTLGPTQLPRAATHHLRLPKRLSPMIIDLPIEAMAVPFGDDWDDRDDDEDREPTEPNEDDWLDHPSLTAEERNSK